MQSLVPSNPLKSSIAVKVNNKQISCADSCSSNPRPAKNKDLTVFQADSDYHPYEELQPLASIVTEKRREESK